LIPTVSGHVCVHDCVGSSGPHREDRDGIPRRQNLVLLREHKDIRIDVRIPVALTPVRAKSRRWLEAMLVAFHASFGKHFGRVWKQESRDAHAKAARLGVRVLIRHLLQAERTVGRKVAYKEFSAWIRRESVGDFSTPRPLFLSPLKTYLRGSLDLNGFTEMTSKSYLFQLSRFSRAGPLPDKMDIDANVSTHFSDLVSGFECSRRMNKSAYRFARSWARNKDWLRGGFPTSLSASFGTAKGKGGMLRELKLAREQFESRVLDCPLIEELKSYTKGILPFDIISDDDFLALSYTFEGLGTIDEDTRAFIEAEYGEVEVPYVGDVLFPFQKSYHTLMGIGPAEWDLVRLHLMTYLTACIEIKRAIVNGDLPDARPVVIQERGEKARMVTPVTYSVAYISMFLNKLLLSALDQDKRVRATDPDPMSGFIHSLSADCPTDWIFRSVDMTRATDLMPLDIVSSLVGGIIDSWGLPPFLSEAFRLCTGPVNLQVDDAVSVRTRRGILMGLGTSWPILSLYNLWLYEKAWTRSGMRRCWSKRFRGMVRTVGDDLLGLIPQSVSDCYTSNLVETGGSPSFGKDLSSKTTGVLVEQAVRRREGCKCPMNPFYRYPSCSVRPLLPGCTSEKDGTVMPKWMMGKQLTDVISDSVHKKYLTVFLQKMYAKEIRLLQRCGVQPFLPRSVGGGNFPCAAKDMRKHWMALRPRWLRALRCAMAFPAKPGLTSHLTVPWSMGPSNPLSERMFNYWLEKSIDAVRPWCLEEELIVRRSRWVVTAARPDADLTAADCTERAIAQASNGQRMLVAEGQPVVRMRLGELQRRLKSGIKKLNSLVPEHKLGDPPSKMWVGLERHAARLAEPVYESSLLPVCFVTGVTIGGTVVPEGYAVDDGDLW